MDYLDHVLNMQQKKTWDKHTRTLPHLVHSIFLPSSQQSLQLLHTTSSQQ